MLYLAYQGRSGEKYMKEKEKLVKGIQMAVITLYIIWSVKNSVKRLKKKARQK